METKKYCIEHFANAADPTFHKPLHQISKLLNFITYFEPQLALYSNKHQHNRYIGGAVILHVIENMR